MVVRAYQHHESAFRPIDNLRLSPDTLRGNGRMSGLRAGLAQLFTLPPQLHVGNDALVVPMIRTIMSHPIFIRLFIFLL